MVKPRLEALINLKKSLDNDFSLYFFMHKVCPFATNIKGDYLIASHIMIDSYIFLIQTFPNGEANCDFVCCSAFKKGERNYEINQKKRILLKKERIHIASNTVKVLFNKLNPE